MEYRDEQLIAKEAEKLLTSALKHKTRSFSEHYYRKEGVKSLKEAYARARVSRYGRKRDGNQKIFMRSLSIHMAKHGFVQHYGVNTIRAGSQRQRTNPRSIEYFYKPHQFRMQSTPFISEAIRQSGVVDFVSEKIGELRAKTFAEELVFNLSQFAKD